MFSLREFENDLHYALVHLSDPISQPSDTVCTTLGCTREEGISIVHTALVQFIESTKADQTMLSDSRLSRGLEVLRERFLLGLTQEATAEHMGIGVRSVARLQRESIRTFALQLWESNRARAAATATEKVAGWHDQLKQELFVLAKSNPYAEANLEDTIRGVLRIARAATAYESVSFETLSSTQNLQVKFHPSVLRESLLEVTRKMQSLTPSGKIALETQRAATHVSIAIRACPVLAETAIDVPLARELVALQGGAITSMREGDCLCLLMNLPLASPGRQMMTVLVVDDNPDVVVLYESYCAGTAYRIAHVREGHRVLQAIADHSPSIILLDVMLPDADGWDVLLDLRANPATRAIPIIICSVVADEELPQKLGASMYLRKPVSQQQLIAVFDQCSGLPQLRQEIARAI